MRVAVITRYFPTSPEPWAGHSAYQTLKFLAQSCDVKVFYPESEYPPLLKPRSRAGRQIDYSFRPAGVDVAYIPYPALPAISRPLNGWSAARSIFGMVRDWQPDVILNYIVYPDGDAARRVAHRLKVPFVVTAIGSDLNVIPPLCGGLTRHVLHQADFTITVSGDLLRTARGLGAPEARSRAVLNGCDTAIFHPRDRNQARTALSIAADEQAIVYIGRLDMAKGLGELVTAVAALAKKRSAQNLPAARCYIVGDGPAHSALAESIAALNAGQHIRLVPACASDGVAQWMAASDLVTLPSYREGCPNVVIEALASGRPVVATDVGGIPELMSNADGRLIPARDAVALERALDEVLSQSWDAQAISKKHSRGWADVATDVETILMGVLNRQPQP
ncbi:MAG: glycosyltransferase [Edaphobacter sp.]|uniref:glycosyltransferase n=1 Tax=Edaphobacter sp. TaxID=1934404 RepID=UPI0023A2B39C|nr:glycosyltransferase [Edaphobacter sp.]MDE1178129.1 glycosyltransferase [Edaphobacter sp.]